MTLALTVLSACLAIALAIVFLLKRRADAQAASERAQAEAAVAAAQTTVDQKAAEFESEIERIRQHYEAEAIKAHDAAHQQLAAALAELESLRAYQALGEGEADVRQTITDALLEAAALRQEANSLLEQTRTAGLAERAAARQRANEIQQRAEALLTQATRDAAQIIADAERRAEQIGGDAYTALRDKEALERAAEAMRNVIDGYGDRYVIPTHSLLDDLAADFGHKEAGEALRAAREQSRRMVTQGEAATCDYAEASRRQIAIRFVIAAFNGAVDAILSRASHDNHGTLSQEIRDAFALVNENGRAFRNARILPAYLDARLAELKWAVAAHELRREEREEQRRIQQQIREEEKARREYERAAQEAARDEAALKQAIQQARAEVETATAQERTHFESQLAELQQRLTEAEAKGQRALSMAQQTRSGNVYIVSNVGSFGDGVVKIGMTRRLVPEDRIKELSDASVPFDFDVHAMIRSDDAPTLERQLHGEFDHFRINKVDYRKEFFRLPMERVRQFVAKMGVEAAFTLAAEAREYRETLALEKMTPEQREKYHVRESESGQLAE